MTATVFEVRLLDRARKEIGDEIENRSAFLIAGTALDYADYKNRCGFIEGMTTALRVLEEAARKLADER